MENRIEGKHTERRSRQTENQNDVFELYFDGCSKGNPGPAGAGAVLYDVSRKEVASLASYVGDRETNNVAEYQGLVQGLRMALEHGVQRLHVKGDSQLVIRQMRGEYQVKSPSLQVHYKEAKDLAKTFLKIDYEHVYRNKNERADALSNIPLLEKVDQKR